MNDDILYKKRISGLNKLKVLLNLHEEVFSLSDIMHLWKFPKKNTLYMTLSRYVKNNFLYKIRNGLYSFSNSSQIDPYLIGTKLADSFCYVSCESVLYDYGIISQKPFEITLISDKSIRNTLLGHNFHIRQVSQKFLLNPLGIVNKNGVWIATLERALADMMYLSPKKYLDGSNSKMIDWILVKNLAEKIGYSTRNY